MALEVQEVEQTVEQVLGQILEQIVEQILVAGADAQREEIMCTTRAGKPGLKFITWTGPIPGGGASRSAHFPSVRTVMYAWTYNGRTLRAGEDSLPLARQIL